MHTSVKKIKILNIERAMVKGNNQINVAHSRFVRNQVSCVAAIMYIST